MVQPAVERRKKLSVGTQEFIRKVRNSFHEERSQDCKRYQNSKRLFVKALKLALELKAFHHLLETSNGLNLKLEGANDFELDV